MQDRTQLIHTLTDTLHLGEIIVTPKAELVLPCAVEQKTGIIMATLTDVSDLYNEAAAQRFIEKQSAA
jgi:hypothetical protein